MNMSTFVGGAIIIGVGLVSLVAFIFPKTNHAPARLAGVPGDFSVRRDESGGMMPSGSSLLVTSTGALYEKYGVEGARQSWQIALSSTEIENLYQALETNQFAAIKTYTQKIYDRGGTSITYTANNQTVIKSDSGTSFIKKGENATRFYTVDKILTQIVVKHVK